MNAMNDDDPEFESLLAPLDRDAPAPDTAFLAALRERGTAAFQATAAPTPRKRIMNSTSFRWLAGLAATLMAGAVLAQWVVRMNRIPVVDSVPEDRFVLNGKLVDDGRIGKVAESQGLVSIKPVLAERWSPVQPQLVLKPGDLLRTDARGANAASLKLLPGTGVIVGPHSMVELVKADQIRLVAGELEVTAGKGAPMQLLGPGQESLKIEGAQFVRIEKEKLVRVEKQPLWLQGFKGSANNESIGSLVAMVDGKNVPLTVGYHHVNVDIRDQIARTVIEESFVNRTDSVLEGVFYFPLPADASISGFGMWIGDQLVEADVVEKQRAREIYETILREKRDPGLLEWAGGNLFKARVYPIPARSEKRIRISYTQVLPMKGNRYRYSYALQSELLKQHPLRELKIDVKVHSAVPLKGVTSPTHDTRLTVTEHSGHVESAAQEYTPTRDFEAVVEVAGRTSDVVVIPHRRGNDGYFMVQMTPPDGSGSWERPLIPNGEPLKLQLIADTSASMDRGQRNIQNTIVASILGALTPKDTINLAMCDVNTDWVFEKPVPATPQNIATIRAALDKRISLGWTNLDKAFASAMAASDVGTHNVYLGDGISTHSDADPVAMAQRITRMYEGKAGTFHAIALGNSYEAGVMKAIAALGGGSFRRVSGEQGPQAVVAELLTEISSPALRNVKVEFRGVRTARVYPEEIPNVAAGSQHILLGRYLPEGQDQNGEIVVSGTLAGKPVQYVSKFNLKDAEQGNSFLPRLWARMHLDKLLQQGTSETIQQEVIALSEEFNIITPYTSLLVLESDADRERFAVKKRFRMSDGEKFFAAGADNANYELKQKQIRLAGDYRTALRRKVLSQLQGMGRDARMFADQREIRKDLARLTSDDQAKWGWSEQAASGSEVELPMYSYNTFQFAGLSGKSASDPETSNLAMAIEETGIPAPLNADESLDDLRAEEKQKPSQPGMPGLEVLENISVHQRDGEIDLFSLSDLNRGYLFEGESYMQVGDAMGRYAESKGQRGKQGYYPRPPLPWLSSYFPPLPATPADAKAPKLDWSAEAIALSKSLVRREKLLAGKGGVAIQRTKEYFNPTGELRAKEERYELASALGWFARSSSDSGPTGIEWCDTKERGSVNTAYQLGRVCASKPNDLAWPALQLNDESMVPLHTYLSKQSAKVEPIAKDRALLTLQNRRQPQHETRYLIDTTRHVLLSVEHLERGKTTGITRFGNFVEVNGTWWAGLSETFDEKKRKIATVKQIIEDVSEEEFRDRMAKGLEETRGTLMLKQPLPSVAEAKAAQNKPTLEDAAVLVLYFAQSQQWAKAKEHLATFERLAKDRSPRGKQFLKNAFQLASRDHETLRVALLRQAKAIAELKGEPAGNRQFLAESLFGIGNPIMSPSEILAFSATFEKIALGQPAYLHAHTTWRLQQTYLLRDAGKVEAAFELSRKLAEEFPGDATIQVQYAQDLAQAGSPDSAFTWIETALKRKWEPSERDSMMRQAAGFLQQQARFAELAEYLARWVALNPGDDSSYSQYLSALIRTNQAAKAEALVASWLREGIRAEELTKPTRAKVYAAVSFAMGQSYYYSNRIDDRWLEPLTETALHFAHLDEELQIAGNILGHWKFHQKVLRTLGAELIAGAATLPVERLERYQSWCSDGSYLKEDDWNKVAASIRTRWDAEKDADRRDRLGQVLVSICRHLGTEPWLAFLRVQLHAAVQEYRGQYARQLFDALLQQPWQSEIETELFGLIEKMSEADDLAGKLAVLHRLDDAMIEARYRAAYKRVEHPEKMPRPELAKKQAELRKKARAKYADRLRVEAGKHPKPFSQWITFERLWLDTLAERDLKAVAVDAWAILDSPAAETPLDALMRERLIITLTHLAARKDADPVRIEELVKYCSDPARKADLFRLLIALDRSKELEAALRTWITGDEANRWKLALSRLLAEQGQLPEAIRLFEAVEADDELTPEAYQSLAQWYLAENRRDGAERARRALHHTTDESRLQQQLNAYLRPWSNPNGRLPSRLEQEVFELFQTLFEKSAWPGNYVPMLQQFYQASRDFRLLAVLAEGTIGHTAGKVYPFLQAMKPVLDDVSDEATVNQLSEKIAEVRKRAKSAVDHRALDLLTVMVERRAAELANQAGPHGARAMAALQESFKREWSPGEPVQMALFLAELGSISEPALAAEQLRELETLHREAKSGTLDHMNIALQYANVLNAAGKVEPSLEVLESTIRAFKGTHGDRLPTVANPVFEQLITFTASARQYERGEKHLLAEWKNPVHAQQRLWLTRQLNEHYLGALRNRGTVSLGQGVALYKAIEKKLYDELQSPNQNQRCELVLQMVRLCRAAKELGFDSAAVDAKAFAFEKLLPILKSQAVNDDDIVREVSRLVHELLGPKQGIAFLLDRAENLPDRARYQNSNFWNQYAHTLGEWRNQAKELGDVEPRLLKYVLAELRQDLRTRESRNRVIYHRQSSYYWEAKKSEFLKAAEKILREKADSPRTAEFVAEYMFDGLKEERRAIEVLQAANKLPVSGRFQLADYLQRTKRFADSIPLLQGLIEGDKDNLTYRTRLMRAYFKTGNAAELAKWLKASDAHFHEKDRWNELVLADLAESCLENKLAAEAVAYYEELIPKYQRSRPNRGIGDSALSQYYRNAADAYNLLGKTKEAVDHASAAVVVWPAGHRERKETLDHLVNVLASSQKLDEYIAALDAEPMQSAIVRKAIGQAFMKKNQHARAIPQFQLAADLQPNDAELYELMVACSDKAGDKEGAVRQLLAGAENTRRNVKLWSNLGNRLKDLGRTAEAERAFTSTVEMLPNESESHTELAEVFGKEKRWSEAIEQWQRVVEIRKLEPNGLLKLANAQIEAKQWNVIPETLRQLRARRWHERFGDVAKQTSDLEQRFHQGMKSD